MPRGDRSNHTNKPKHQAEQIKGGYKKKRVSKNEAERRPWPSVKNSDKGGKKADKGSSTKKRRATAKRKTMPTHFTFTVLLGVRETTIPALSVRKNTFVREGLLNGS